MNRVKLVVAGAAVAVCVTAVTASSASAESSVKAETTAVAFQEASTKPEKVVGGDGRMEPRCGWAGFAKGIAQGVVGNAAYEAAKYAMNHPAKPKGYFMRGGIPVRSEVSASEMSRAFD
ncbi:hypothetical protein [Streptomyces sp. NRRL S-1448]|uniref:hypothetical protein n=1 Tax=Streptomyces sp. NRRL S-1448 TaxID=1463883 RepID=UPI00131E90FD|nr:hypothetical protein [Streptomyces sp. NRRL S-1448]